MTVEILRKICSGNDRALELLNNVTIEELKPVGGVEGHKGANHNTTRVDNINPSESESKGGTSQEYLLARIKRDAPDVFDDYANGEFPSVRAAAIAAGIVKVQSPYEMVAKQLHKLDRLELMDLQARIESLLQEM